MKVLVLSKEHTDYARAVETYLSDFHRQTGYELEVIDPDSREGESICRLYDIVEYPTIIVTSNDGVIQRTWSGTSFPPTGELAYYVSQE